jgi:hypothetical protein
MERVHKQQQRDSWPHVSTVPCVLQPHVWCFVCLYLTTIVSYLTELSLCCFPPLSIPKRKRLAPCAQFRQQGKMGTIATRQRGNYEHTLLLLSIRDAFAFRRNVRPASVLGIGPSLRLMRFVYTSRVGRPRRILDKELRPRCHCAALC